VEERRDHQRLRRGGGDERHPHYTVWKAMQLLNIALDDRACYLTMTTAPLLGGSVRVNDALAALDFCN
jgi:hypothetical protein